MSKPIVAIVGRANVGKSTLFNQIGKKRLSIVDDLKGVTRDRIYMDAEWLNHEFTLVDTGGIEWEKNDKILDDMRKQVQIAILEADVIVFLTDGRVGVTAGDLEIAKKLRETKKPVLVAVNKIDSPKQELDVYEFYQLGLGEVIPIAAANALNLGDLLDAVVQSFANIPRTEEETDEIKIAVIGRPNVGKSSLVNAILGEDRVIVSDIAGTTRDAIDTHFIKDGIKFTLIDTAGMRRKKKIEEAIERYSVMRALRAVDRSDVILLVLDATEGITEQDKKIAGYVYERGKGIIVVVNKWDIFPAKDEKSTLAFTDMARKELAFLQYAPILYTSALTKKRVSRVTELVKYVDDQQSMRVQTSLLNDLLRDAIALNPPPAHKGKPLKIYFMVQADIKPPRFIVFVNDKELMHFSYLRFLENKIREIFGFEGATIRLIVRNRKEEDQSC